MTHDDLYVSESKFKDFFVDPAPKSSSNFYETEMPMSNVVFKIKDYDMVGPEEFHADNVNDKLRDKFGKPYLSIDLTFESLTPKNDKMALKLIYPMSERHMLISTAKRSFRAQKPKSATVVLNGGPLKECQDLVFSFQVRNSYIKYLLEDQADNCFPFAIEGKWHLNMTKAE